MHAKFGERIAVLTGDALIVAAFQTLASHAVQAVRIERMPLVTAIVARGVGAPHGICAGQAWECEQRVDLSRYTAPRRALYSWPQPALAQLRRA